MASIPSLNTPSNNPHLSYSLSPVTFSTENRYNLFGFTCTSLYLWSNPTTASLLHPPHQPLKPQPPLHTLSPIPIHHPFPTFGLYPLLHPIISPIFLHNLTCFTTFMISLLSNHCRLNGKQHESLMLGNG